MESFVKAVDLTLEFLTDSLALAFIVLVITVIVLFIIDRQQTAHAIRRNYPVIGRFRYWFEHLGSFLRQYFFALDREELPFNRAQRSWVYRAAKNVERTIAFGSTHSIRQPGSLVFANSAFPVLDEDAQLPSEIEFGPHCRTPYKTNAIFCISGMSYGAISKPAIKALSRGAAEAGCWLNTGEGGLSSYHLRGNCDIVYQIGTAKYGVRDEHGKLSEAKLKEVAAKEQVKMFEIKLSQGAKPGKGGILPAEKVSAEVAAIRGIPIGVESVSPNRHPEIKSAGDLLDMIHFIREATGKPVGFKAVMGDEGFLEELCLEIRSRGIESAPDFITLDGGDGGTGAAPVSLMDYVGMPLQESLPIVVLKLQEFGFKDRIKVIASGKLINPNDVAWALAVGADVVTSARGFMFALGCIQALQCNRNTCPTGIATHNPDLQRGLVPQDKAVRVASYVKNMVYEVSVIAHSCGVEQPRAIRPEHVRIVQDNGNSLSLKQIYPNLK